MFQINDVVVYGYSEVCLVKDIKTPEFIKTGEEYYFLQPLTHKASTLYVKTANNQKAMRVIMSKDKAEEIMNDIQELPALYNENDKLREKEYLSIITACDCVGWFQALKGLSQEKKRRNDAGLKLNMVDEKNYKRVETCIASEFSMIFNISTEEVRENLKLAGL